MKTLLLSITFISTIFSLTNISSPTNRLYNNYNILQNNFCNTIDICSDYAFTNLHNDSSSQMKKHKFYLFEDKLENLRKIDIDSLLRNYRVEIDLDKYLNEDYYKYFNDKLLRYWKDIPRLDKKHLDDLLKDLENNIEKDSLLKRFKLFRKNNLFDNSEITEI